jgi:membrane-bound lytic murein transglycosylase A
MQTIKEWLRADPERAKTLMWENRSYVFFEERKDADAELGPVGAQGVALTPGRSLAVDPSYHALGTPVFVVAAAELKDEDGTPFERLMIAQDVGSAISGPERGDIFFGSGDEAGAKAGTTLVPGDFIVLKPKDAPGS